MRDYLKDKDKDIDFIEFAQNHIEQLKREDRAPYSRSFRTVRNSLIDYIRRSSISITEINSNMLYDYEKFLKRARTQVRVNQLEKQVEMTEAGLSDSGLHNHMRDLRTLFNAACKIYNNEDLGLMRIKHYPFKKYKVGSPPMTKKSMVLSDFLPELVYDQPALSILSVLNPAHFQFSF